MSIAIFTGVTSGALHAVTGPDHLLSLGPAALGRGSGAAWLGARWGLGHGAGTLVLALPLLALLGALPAGTLHSLGHLGEFAGALAMAFFGVRAARQTSQRASLAPDASSADEGRAFAVGAIHGVTGAASLLFLLPHLGSGSSAEALAFLSAFVVGSTVAMAGFTSALGRARAGISPAIIEKGRSALSHMSAWFGLAWVARLVFAA